MSSEILTIEEVAKYLRVSERTVYEWAQKGEIPSGKIGTVWRFKKQDIENWVDTCLASNRLVSMNKAKPVSIKSCLTVDRVLFLNDDLPKNDILAKMVDSFSTASQIKNSNELLPLIIERDSLMSTAIGYGIAIPHIKLNSVKGLVMAIGISKNGLSCFDSIDKKPVHFVIMIVASLKQNFYYLQTVAHMSLKLKDEDIRTRLIQSTDASEAYSILCR